MRKTPAFCRKDFLYKERRGHAAQEPAADEQKRRELVVFSFIFFAAEQSIHSFTTKKKEERTMMKQDLFLSERLEQLHTELLGLARLLEQADVKPRPQLDDYWIDGADVMNMLHISPRTLQTLRTNGTLGYTTLGKKFFYRLQEIDDLLRNNYVMYRLSARGHTPAAPSAAKEAPSRKGGDL